MGLKVKFDNGTIFGFGVLTDAGNAAYHSTQLNVTTHPGYYDISEATELKTYVTVGSPAIKSGDITLNRPANNKFVFTPNPPFALPFECTPNQTHDNEMYILLYPGGTDSTRAVALIRQGTQWWFDEQKLSNGWSSTNLTAFLQMFKVSVPFPGPSSTIGGGIGNFDLTSDPIDFPSLPSSGAVNSGFCTLYNPTEGELSQIAGYMWTSDMGQAWEAIFQLISDPMDMVIGLNMYPFTIPSAALSPNKVDVEAGPLDIYVDPLTKVQSYMLRTQYLELDCGSLDVGQFYGNALDFQPYTKATIHVPFCGDYPLNIDDIRSNLDASVNGKTLHLKYHVDMFSGACVAMLKVGDAVLYQWSGSMAMNVPMTGNDYSNTIQNVISTATTIGMVAAGAGAAGAGGAAGAEAAGEGASSAAMASDARLADLAGATTDMVASLKPNIQRAGSIAGSAGFLGVQDPYIVFEIPRQSIADGYAKYTGFPCNISYRLSDLTGKGFTVVSDMHLEGLRTGASTDTYRAGATDREIGEVETLLNGGVIL